MRMRFPILASMVFALTAGSGASQTAGIPLGCQPMLTVEAESCFATSYFDCGDDIRIISYGMGAKRQVLSYTRDQAFLSSVDHPDDRETYIGSTGDTEVFSMSALLEAGLVRTDRTLSFANHDDPRIVRVKGLFKLTGQSITVGDVQLMTGRAQYGIETVEGVEIGRLATTFYVPGNHNIMIEGGSYAEWTGKQGVRENHTPRAIHFAGDPLFLTSTSRFGCEDE